MNSEENEDAAKTIEEKLLESIHRVTQIRKHYPKKLSHLLSKKIKMEHHMLENVKIILEGNEKGSEGYGSAEKCETLCLSDADQTISDNIADLQKEIRNLMKVVDNIKSEADCPIHKMIEI